MPETLQTFVFNNVDVQPSTNANEVGVVHHGRMEQKATSREAAQEALSTFFRTNGGYKVIRWD